MTDYYVDPARPNDGGAGTSTGTAWKTLTYALGPSSPLAAGDTLSLLTGNYDEIVRVQKSGTSGNPIIIKPHTGADPVLRGVSGTQRILEIINRQYLTFEAGIKLSYNWSPPGGVVRFPWLYIGGDACSDIVLNGLEIERTGWSNLNTLAASTWDEWGITVDGASRITINGAWIRGVGTGIQFKGTGTDCVLKYSDIQYTRASNVTIATSYGQMRKLLIAYNHFGYSAIEDGVQGMPEFGTGGVVSSTDDSNRGVVIIFNEFEQDWENGIDRKGCAYWTLHGNVFHGVRGSNDGIAGLNRNSINTIGRGHSNEGNPHDMLDRYNILYDNAAGWWIIPGSKIYNNTLIWNNTDYSGSGSSYAAFYALNQERRINLYKTCLINNIICGPHNGAALALYMDLGGASHQLDLAGNLYGGESFRDNAAGTLYGSFSAFKTALAAMAGIRRAEENSALVANQTAIGFVNVPAHPTGAPATYDFTLQTTSPGRGAGQYVTKTTGSGTAQTWVTVEDCGVFTDWYGIVNALLPTETVYFGGPINATRTVLEVDYTNNRIRLDAAVTFTAGIPIWHGSTPTPNAGSGGWLEANPNPPPPPPPSGGTGKRAVTSFVLNTSTGDQNVPLPFTLDNAPKLFRLAWTPCTSSGTPVDGMAWGYGFAYIDGGGSVVQGAISVRGRHNINPGDTSRRSSATSCILIQDPTNGGIDAEGTLLNTGTTTSNVRINLSNAPAGSYLVMLEATDCLDKIGAHVDIPASLNATTTAITISGWTNEPQLVYAWGTNKADPANSAHARAFVGIASVISGAITQQCYILSHEDNQSPTKSAAYLSSAYMGGECDANGALQRAVELTTASKAGGIQFTVRAGAYPDATADMYVMALSFDDLQVWAGIVTTPTAATNPWEGIEPGFDAGSVEILATAIQTNNTATLSNDGGAFGLGWWDAYSGNQVSTAAESEHAQTSSDTQSSTSTTKIIDMAQADGSTGLQANITGTTATKVQANFTAALAAARKLIVSVVEKQASASITAGFTASATTVEVGESVSFTNTSTASGTTITDNDWDFDDGGTSTATNPSHAWSLAGTYTVTLVAGDGTISDTETVVITVTAAPPPPVIPTAASDGVLGGGNADLGIYSQVLGGGL